MADGREDSGGSSGAASLVDPVLVPRGGNTGVMHRPSCQGRHPSQGAWLRWVTGRLMGPQAERLTFGDLARMVAETT